MENARQQLAVIVAAIQDYDAPVEVCSAGQWAQRYPELEQRLQNILDAADKYKWLMLEMQLRMAAVMIEEELGELRNGQDLHEGRLSGTDGLHEVGQELVRMAAFDDDDDDDERGEFPENEYICRDCRETNLLQPGEDPNTRQCDDCHKVGTLITFERDEAAARRNAGDR